VALPQPDRNEQLPTDGPPSAPASFAASLLAGSPPGAVWLTVCAWCERIKIHGRWVDAERALELMKVPADGGQSLTHGICPSCLAVEMRRSDRERRLGTHGADAA
jgi:hypothetical protein